MLKDLYDYNTETGIFIRKYSTKGFLEGTRAGSITQRGYRKISIGTKAYLEHKLAWFYVHGVYPNYLDHINGEKTDNRIANLRETTHTGNMGNRKLLKNNTTGFPGVERRKDRFRAVIRIDKKRIHLGYYADAESAFCAYKAKHAEVYGTEWSHLVNSIDAIPLNIEHRIDTKEIDLRRRASRIRKAINSDNLLKLEGFKNYTKDNNDLTIAYTNWLVDFEHSPIFKYV